MKMALFEQGKLEGANAGVLIVLLIIIPSAWLICDKRERRLGISLAHMFFSPVFIDFFRVYKLFLIFCNPYISIEAKYDYSAVFACSFCWFITLLPSLASKTMQVNQHFCA